MNKLPNHTSLKEWSSVIHALDAGTQVVLIRKGGLADPGFGVEAERFYLYPTYFHQGESEARPRVTITHWCEVVRTWSVTDERHLSMLQPLVAMPHDTLETRYRFRPDQALHVIGVRVFRLAKPTDVAFRDAYGGCRSWISVDEEIDIDGSEPVLAPAELAAKIAAVDTMLSAAA